MLRNLPAATDIRDACSQVNVKTMKLELPDKTSCSKQGNIYYIGAKLDICPLCSSAES